MKRTVNLMPLATQRRFEQRRQARRWAVVWLATALVLAAGYLLLEQDHRRAQVELEDARAAVAALREAADEAHRMQVQGSTLRRLVEASRALEQTDVPLALLQVVGESCREQGAVQLDSLRIDEIGATTAAGGKNTAPRKQLVLVGVADADVRVSSLVSHLRASGAFHNVELVSSQAQSDEPGAKRSFQIRCEQ